jgi:hypothetical protein
MTAVIHIAGPPYQIKAQLRQRCGWCGACLIDYDLSRMAVSIPEGKTAETMTDEERRPGTFETFSLVEVDGNAQWGVEHADGEPLPQGCCALLDPAVTA